MKFFLSGLGNRSDSLEAIKEAVVEADGLGFDGALMPDHYMWGEMRGHRMPNAYSTLETWVTLTYLAAKTERIRLGTLVTPIPFRPPGVLAKMLSTLDILSNGRVMLGVGAGWSQDEFDGYSVWDGPKVRVDKTEEGLKLMIRLWTEDEVNFEGKFYEAKGAVLDPKPVQKPYPELLFGSYGSRMIRLAAKYANICYVGSMIKMMNPDIKSRIEAAAEKAGRTNEIAYMEGEMGVMGPYDPDGHVEKIEAAIAGGCSYYMVPFPNASLVESMTQFAEEIMPSYQ
ncbi:MAG: LLM class flavin-dependent oxidoreductase [Candidatus Bathyarchaeota archaeon]|nr:MAG: LLM class flavin-dependent oxidoreductase [Candidatus Bathyarchaeota archaeon]